MESLQAELDHFEQNLPADLKLNLERLTLMVHSDDSVKYVALWVHWMQCHCDLYRFCVPGIRESIAKEVMAQTSAEFIAHCQTQCLRMAIQLCDFWAQLWDLEPSGRVSDRFIPVSIYQVAQILRQLRHLLPQEGEHCVARLQQKLRYALAFAEPLQSIFLASEKCLVEAEKVIRSLGENANAYSTRASSVDDEITHGHLASRFSLVQNLLTNSHTVENESQVQSVMEQPTADLSGEAAHDVAHVMIDIASIEQAEIRPLDNMMPWDPFDVQMNDYYNPVLGDFLSPLGSQHDYPIDI